MSTCERCGATFHCAMNDATAGDTGGDATPCWCTLLPPAVPVPRRGVDMPGTGGASPVGCWCPACLKAHIAGLDR